MSRDRSNGSGSQGDARKTPLPATRLAAALLLPGAMASPERSATDPAGAADEGGTGEPAPGEPVRPESALGQPPFLTCMTYNVRTFLHRRSSGETDRVAEVVRRHEPDVLALQEVDVGRLRSGGLHQARELADRLGMEWHFQAALERDGGEYGIALLSRHPMEVMRSARLPLLPDRSAREPRGAIWARIDVDGMPVQVVATHLGLTRRERHWQLDDLLGPRWLADPRCLPPLVFLGDLNCVPGSGEYVRLTTVLGDAVRSALFRCRWRATLPSILPVVRVDHVLVSPDLPVRRARISRGPVLRRASDHLPVVVELDRPRMPEESRHQAPPTPNLAKPSRRRPGTNPAP